MGQTVRIDGIHQRLRNVFLAYHILEDLNVRSSVTYLAKVQHGGEH